MSDGAEREFVPLGDAGACPEITLNGKVWKIGHPTRRAREVLEELCRARAVTEVVSMRESLPPAAYREAFAAVTGMVTARKFKTWASGWLEIMDGPDTGVLFLLALLREKQPDATEADAAVLAEAKRDEVELAIAAVSPPFLELLAAAYPTPAKRPEVLEYLRSKIASLLPQKGASS